MEPPSHRSEIGVFYLMIPAGIIRCHEVHGRSSKGGIVAWEGATAHGADTTLQRLVRPCDGRRIVLSDTAFHAAEGDPTNLKLCQRGAWEGRLLVETVLVMLPVVGHVKQVMHRVWAYVHRIGKCIFPIPEVPVTQG